MVWVFLYYLLEALKWLIIIRALLSWFVPPHSGNPVVRLLRRRSASGCLPSVDPMFASVGSLFGGGALGIVLTGMGRDGQEGATHLVACGGSVIVQDEASSAVWGMPRAVAEAGLACAIANTARIAQLVAYRAEEGMCK